MNAITKTKAAPAPAIEPENSTRAPAVLAALHEKFGSIITLARRRSSDDCRAWLRKNPAPELPSSPRFRTDPETIAKLRNREIERARDIMRRLPDTRNLILHLRDTASGRGGAAAVETLTAERARLAHEQADAHALKNKITRGELVEASAVTERWSHICATIRSRMLAVPTMAAADIPAMTRIELDIIDRHIRAGLTELADGFEGSNQDD